MIDILPPLAYQLGIGGIGGFIVGYAIKKLSKLIVVLAGLLMIFLLYLGINNIISINYEALWEMVADFLGFVGETIPWFIAMVSVLPFAGSFVLGFVLGLQLG
ncbi:MAG: FUN14 domain-containing protein [Candidatus Bathyarchaeia archaeon]